MRQGWYVKHTARRFRVGFPFPMSTMGAYHKHNVILYLLSVSPALFIQAAMGEIMRRWSFDVLGQPDSFHLIIREPSLTGHDAIGLKTWGSSYALANLLPQFSSGPVLSHLLSPVHRHQEEGGGGRKAGPVRMLELGSGTGLLGLAAACFWQADIVLTDLPAILPNLEHNAELNRAVWEAHGGRVEVAALTWGADETESSSVRFKALHQYEVNIRHQGGRGRVRTNARSRCFIKLRG